MTAKRGDLAVIECQRSTTSISSGPNRRTVYEVHRVTGITRGGEIRETANVAYPSETPTPLARKFGFIRTHLLPAAAVSDMDGLLDAVRSHTYPKSTTAMPWDDIEDLRDLLDPYRKPREDTT